MKTIKSLVAFFAFAIIVASCNKKNNNNTPASPAPSPTPTPVTGYYGLFDAAQVIYSTVPTPSYWAAALFYEKLLTTPSTYFSDSLGMYAGVVSLNGKFLKNNISSNGQYDDTTNSVITGATNWIASGSGTIPAISYSDNNPWPSFTGTTTIIDTLYLTQTNSINVSNKLNVDEMEVFIINGVGYAEKLYIPGTATNISFSPSELSSLSPTLSGVLIINFHKNNFQTFSGKTYKFIKTLRYIKTIVVK